jgi:tetratricopeptide (TPR) repeat protein
MRRVVAERPASVARALELENGGEWSQAISVLESAVGTLLGRARIDAALQLGKLYKYTAAFPRAVAVLTRALAHVGNSDLHLRLEIDLQRAVCYQYLGKYDDARHTFIHILDDPVGVNDPYLLSHALMQLGIMDRLVGEPRIALRRLRKCWKIKHDHGMTRDEAAALEQMGIAVEMFRHWTWALELFETSRNLKQQVGYYRGLATYHLRIGSLHISKGEYLSARRELLTSLNMRQEIGDTVGIASSLHHLAENEYFHGSLAEASVLVDEALGYRRMIRDRRRLARTLSLRAIICAETDRPDEAMRQLKRAICIQSRLGLLPDMHDSLRRAEWVAQRFRESMADPIAARIAALLAGLSTAQRWVIERAVPLRVHTGR